MKKYKCGHCMKEYDKLWVLYKHMYEKHGVKEPKIEMKLFGRK